MPKIEITEQDLTSPGVVDESFDVVYIPGYVASDNPELWYYKENAAKDYKYTAKDYVYAGLKPNVPTLFKSVTEFEAKCGKYALSFGTTQYPNVEVPTDSKVKKSTDETVPADTSTVGVPGGLNTEVDTSYLLAKELLAAGIPVLYENIGPKCFAADATVTDTGSTDTGSTGTGSTNNGSTDTGSTGNGTTEPETTEPGSTEPETTEPGTTTPETTEPASTDDGSTGTGSTDSGSTGTGSTDSGSTGTGSTDSGSTGTGSTDSGSTGTGSTGTETKKVVFITTYYSSTKIGVYSVQFNEFYTDVQNAYNATNPVGIVDKGNFNFKYITSGGRPVLTSVDAWETTLDTVRTKMLAVAAARGDCVALIDYDASFDEDINPNGTDSLFQDVLTLGEITDGEYGAMFTPWATYNRLTSDVNDDGKRESAPIFMPASFAYLTSLAHSIKTNANWLAVAGVARGSVRNVSELNANIPNAVADTMQARTGTSINAITNIKPYGNTIWGNRTLKFNEENLTATSFLNIRNLVSDVRKVAYRAARRNTFEQDTDVMWLNFKTEISTLLDRMKSGYGISGYKIVRNYEHERAAEKATVCARIILYPTYAVEDFYIDIILKDDEITVE